MSDDYGFEVPEPCLEIACRYCGADEGSPCKSKAGNEQPNAHSPRRRDHKRSLEGPDEPASFVDNAASRRFLEGDS